MGADLTLHQSLEREFCPPLDPSLIAALLVDISIDGEPPFTDAQADALRSTLKELAAQAELDERQLAAQISDVHLSIDISGSSTSESLCGDSAATSSTSGSSQQPFCLPLGFLQAALPHIRTERLKSALELYGAQLDDTDMAAVVESLLTDEYLRELEERGLDVIDEDGDPEKLVEAEEQAVKPRQQSRQPDSRAKTHRQNNRRRATITFGDVRQTQKRRTMTSKDNTQHLQASATDPWTQLSSLSAYIASLVPSHPPSFFQSYFHSPEHGTPYNAMLAALNAIRTTVVGSDQPMDLLPDMLEILLPSYDNLDSERRSRLISDTQLALNVTQGRADDTLDLVKLLRDLDLDAPGSFGMGIYHSPCPSPSSVATTSSPKSKPFATVSHVPVSLSSSKSAPTVHPNPDPFQWQLVPIRRANRNDPNPLAAFIPAYNRGPTKGKDNGKAKGGTVDASELSMSQAQKLRRRMEERMRKRNDLLRQASDAWQRGNSRTRGGEVALYYAQQARECHDAALKDSLEASRIMVESKRVASQDGSIDLHGITSAEAVTIVMDILQTAGSPRMYSEKPLKIITGRGKHSHNKVGILKPVIKNALVQEGWIVDTWDGGLLVRGKRGYVA